MEKVTDRTSSWIREGSATRTPTIDEYPLAAGHGPASGDTPLAIVGDIPLDDRSAKFLYWGLSQAEVYVSRLWQTSLVTRRVPRADHPNVNAALDAAQAGLQQELGYLVRRRGLKAVVVSGSATLRAFGLTAPVAQLRGSVYVWDVERWEEATEQGPTTVLVLPTYAADYLAKNRWTRSGKGRADFAAVWLDDLTKAKRLAAEGWNPPAERFNLTPTLNDVKAFVEEAITTRRLLAVDIETTGFTPDVGEVVCVGLATGPEDAIVVPFLDGLTAYWPTDIERQVKGLLSRAFVECPLMFQNALFDVPFLQGSGFECPMTSVVHDTLLLHHAVSPELPHKLGFIVSQYGDTPYWKEEFQNRDTTIRKMDQMVLRRYNARDCVVLHQVLPGLLADLEEVGAGDVYEQESIGLLPAILEMMQTGVVFDARARDALRARLTREVDDAEQDLRVTGRLPAAFNLDSDDDLRLLLFGDVSAKYAKGEEYETKKPGTKVRQQLEDLHTVRHSTPPLYLPVGFKGRRTDTGKLTVNKQGRLSYQRHLQNRLRDLGMLRRPTAKHTAEVAAIENALTWLGRFQEYTELKKILSTYMDYPTGDDNRVHTKFIIHGTATGRLACVAGDTQLLTDQGMVSIEEYDPAAGARVYTHWGTWEIVRRKIYKGIDLMQKVTLSSGETLTATQDHRVLVRGSGWKPVGELTLGEEIVYVSEEKVLEQQRSLSESGRNVSQPGEADYRVYVETDRGNPPDGIGDSPTGTAVGGFTGRAGLTVLPFKDGNEEPDEGEDRRTAPQLGRGMLRRQGLLNNIGPWEAVFRSPSGDGRAAGYADRGPAFNDGSTPHRSRSAEQRSGELGLSNSVSSPEPAWTYAKVMEKTDVGALRVWDLEVDHAHSYWAGGVFNHNSREPNLQNLPKRRSKDIRRMFIAPQGWKIVAADYANLEVKVMAYETRDPVLIDIVDNGKNMHDLNTEVLFGLTPDDPMWEPARRAAKIFMFGSLAYGGGDNEIYEKVIIDVPELRLTFREFVAAKQRYMDSHPVYTAWRDGIAEKVTATRRVRNAFGRQRTFYGNARDIVKEALNFPIQSAAASIINRATVRIHRRLREEGYATRLQAQIHDELRLEAPDEEVEAVVRMLHEEMEAPVDFHGIQRTFAIEVEYGQNWAELVDEGAEEADEEADDV